MKESYILQINPKRYRLYDALKNLPPDCNELVLNDGDGHGHLHLQPNKRVYFWDTWHDKEGRLVGRGKVFEARKKMEMPKWQCKFCTKEYPYVPDEKRAVIHVDDFLQFPISRKEIRANEVLRNASFFKNIRNTEGAVHKITDDAVVKALDNLIDKNISYPLRA